MMQPYPMTLIFDFQNFEIVVFQDGADLLETFQQAASPTTVQTAWYSWPTGNRIVETIAFDAIDIEK